MTMIEWIRDYRMKHDCSLADARSAFEASPERSEIMDAMNRHRLIEDAAPDLLDALREMVRYHGMSDPSTSKARLAIAKAEGRAA